MKFKRKYKTFQSGLWISEQGEDCDDRLSNNQLSEWLSML